MLSCDPLQYFAIKYSILRWRTRKSSKMFVLKTILVVPFFFHGTIAALTSNLGPVIDIGYAAFAGNTTSPAGVDNSPVTFFGNIPYAKPPLGDLRWRAPQPLNEHATAREVNDARNWGPPCIQR